MNMKLNNKGFTLIELLAAMVILAAIMAIAVPNIMGILNNSRADAYVEDAKKMISLAEYKVRANPELKPTSVGSCTKITLKYLDNSEFKNAPNNGSYHSTNSFVIVRYASNAGGKKKYDYYVTLVENLGSGKGTRGISFQSYTKLYSTDPSKLVKNSPSLSVSSCNSIKTY